MICGNPYSTHLQDWWHRKLTFHGSDAKKTKKNQHQNHDDRNRVQSYHDHVQHGYHRGTIPLEAPTPTPSRTRRFVRPRSSNSKKNPLPQCQCSKTTTTTTTSSKSPIQSFSCYDDPHIQQFSFVSHYIKSPKNTTTTPTSHPPQPWNNAVAALISTVVHRELIQMATLQKVDNERLWKRRSCTGS